MVALGIGLLIIAVIVSLVGGIMFTIAAFRQSALWGLAVLFIPFANLVFLVKYWQEAKKSFFINLAGCGVGVVAMIALVVGGAGAANRALAEAAQNAQEQAMRAEGLDPAAMRRERAARTETQRQVAVTPVETSPAAETLLAEPPVAGNDEAAAFERLTETPAAPPIAEEIAPRDLVHHIGERLSLIDQNGRELRGTVLSVGPRVVRIERDLSGGSIRYDVARADIQKVRTLD